MADRPTTSRWAPPVNRRQTLLIKSGRSSKARTEADTSSARQPRRSQSLSEPDLGSAFDPTRTVARAGTQDSTPGSLWPTRSRNEASRGRKSDRADRGSRTLEIGRLRSSQFGALAGGLASPPVIACVGKALVRRCRLRTTPASPLRSRVRWRRIDKRIVRAGDRRQSRRNQQGQSCPGRAGQDSQAEVLCRASCVVAVCVPGSRGPVAPGEVHEPGTDRDPGKEGREAPSGPGLLDQSERFRDHRSVDERCRPRRAGGVAVAAGTPADLALGDLLANEPGRPCRLA